jgi:hypothetical protein
VHGKLTQHVMFTHQAVSRLLGRRRAGSVDAGSIDVVVSHDGMKELRPVRPRWVKLVEDTFGVEYSLVPVKIRAVCMQRHREQQFNGRDSWRKCAYHMVLV